MVTLFRYIPQNQQFLFLETLEKSKSRKEQTV